MPVVPIYYYGSGMVARRGVEGPGMISWSQTANAWNIQEWDVR